MFKKTRNRIMLLNMLIVSSVVLVAFAAIFLTSYTRVEAENQKRFEIDSSRPFIMGENMTISYDEWTDIARGLLPSVSIETIIIDESVHRELTQTAAYCTQIKTNP